jgi:uncharacterized membrane protein YcaP (DUF421 family)
LADWLHIVLRSLFAIAALFLFARILGKRQITQLTFFEYITGITIGSIAAMISLNTSLKWYLGAVSLAVWLLVSLGLELLTLKSKTARDIVEGKGTVLIKNGKILENNLKKVRYNSDELLEQLRLKNAFKVADVEFAVLETSGNISVLLKKENQPLTAKMVGAKVSNMPESQTVVMDGNIMNEPLATAGLSRQWLLTELEKIGVSLDNVYLAQVDGYGQLHVDLYDDQIQLPQSQNKALLLATLKKCEADLEIFALSTKNKQSKLLYEEAVEQMNRVLSDVKPYLQ